VNGIYQLIVDAHDKWSPLPPPERDIAVHAHGEGQSHPGSRTSLTVITAYARRPPRDGARLMMTILAA